MTDKNPTKRTDALRQIVPELAERLSANPPLAALASHSDDVKPNDIFIAQKGALPYCEKARAAGAAFALSREAPPKTLKAFCVHVPDIDERLTKLLDAFYPEMPQTRVAVTGSNGKSSIVHFLGQIWARNHLSFATLGTLGFFINGKQEDAQSLTTPNRIATRKYLHRAAREGVTHIALEASSHALAQGRLEGLCATHTAFTNLSRDHLDYHHSLDAYFEAKTRLFSPSVIAPDAKVVINRYDPWGEKLFARLRSQSPKLDLFSLGGSSGDLLIRALKASPQGQYLSFALKGRGHEITLPLIGDFQVSNALQALSLALLCGADSTSAIGALSELKPVPGRMEYVATHPKGGGIFVDYAHGPAALERVLRALRAHSTRPITLVFGAGGDRDQGKRKEMADVAARHAQKVYVTDDNPRYEPPEAIRRELLRRLPGAFAIADRREAIAHAILKLENNANLLVAGRGHETYQTYRDQKRPFHDPSVIRQIIRGSGLT